MKALLSLTLLAIAPAICPAQDQLADMLRKGIVEEDVNHNPAAAIHNYQSALSRFAEERTAAATALFRMAECYRKLGNSADAAAAYNRIVTEFADQTALVAKSRQQLPKSSAAPPEPASSALPDSAEARRRYRAALQAKVDMAYQHLNEVNKQLQLGAAGPLDGTDAAMAMVHAQREVAAFDAGLLGPQAPGAAPNAAAKAARTQVRALLLQEADLAQQAFAAEQRRYQLGTSNNADFDRRKTAVLNLEQELAVLDAMPGQPVPPPRRR